MDDFDRDVWCLLGIPVDAMDMAGAVRAVSRAAADRTPCFLSTPNVKFLISPHADSSFYHCPLSIPHFLDCCWCCENT